MIKNQKVKIKNQSLEELRNKINMIDSKLLELLGERFEIVKQIGEYKKENNLPISNPEREKERIEAVVKEAEKLGIQREVIEKIWKTFFEVSYIIEDEKISNS